MKRFLLFIAGASIVMAQAIPSVSDLYTASWTSATPAGCPGAGCLQWPTQGFNAALVAIQQTSGTFTNGGTAAFEGSDTPDNTVTDNWFSVPCAAPTTNGSQYLFTSNVNVAAQCNVVGFQRFRVRLSNPIAGTGTANISLRFASLGVPPPGGTPPTGTVTANQGTNPWQTSVTAALPAGANDIGTVDQTGTTVWFSIPVLPPVTSGATVTRVVYMPTPYYTNATSTSTYTQIKATAANVWGYAVQNPNASTCWLQFYNATAPSLGSSIFYSVPVLGSGGIAQMLPFPINLSTALSIATTTAGNGGTACSTGMGVTIYYQ